MRPVGIREIWQQLLAKLVVEQAGEQSPLACSSIQLCANLEVGIEGTLHVTRKWAQAQSETNSGPRNGIAEVADIIASQFSQLHTPIQ